MKHLVRAPWFSVLAVPALASCAFILDFDSLQAEKDAGQGGHLLTAGTTGEGGAAAHAGAGAGDICEGVVGLVLDGIDASFPAERHYRVTAVAGDDDFFLSSFSLTGEGPSLTLYRVAAEGGDASELGTLDGSSIGELGEPSSAAGLAFQPGIGLLHAFVGTKKEDSGSRVRRLVMNGATFEMIATGLVVSESYWDVSPYNYPVAITLDDRPAVAWINEDQTIGLDGGPLEQTETLAADGDVMALTLVASDDDQPEVLYGTTSGGVFVERPGVDPVAVEECQTAPGGYLSFASTFTGVSGFWLASWTKLGLESDDDEAYLTTEGLGMFCGSEGACTLQNRECSGTIENNLVRNPAASIVHRPSTSAGLVEVVTATPVLEPGEEPDTIAARLLLGQSSVDFGVPPFENPAMSEEIAATFALAEVEGVEAPEYRGPDWPVIAHLPPDHYLIAWIEPNGDDEDVLRIQRYRMCLP